MTSWRTERYQQTLSLDLVQGEEADAQVFGCLLCLQYDFSLPCCHAHPPKRGARTLTIALKSFETVRILVNPSAL
jgi:hypothetical protein